MSKRTIANDHHTFSWLPLLSAISSVPAAIRDLIWPRGCAGCDMPDEIVCNDCMRLLHDWQQLPMPGTTCGALTCGMYRGNIRQAILAWKDHGDEECNTPFAIALADLLTVLLRHNGYSTYRTDNASASNMGGTDHATGRTDRPVLLVPAPSSRSSMRRRGRWHMRALAVRAARMLSHQGFDVRVIPLLRTTGVSSKSVQMNTIAQRSHRLAGRIAVQRRVFNQHNTTDGDEMRVILLDDIITSGATATYCVQALRDVGAEVLAVVTLAYTPDPRQART